MKWTLWMSALGIAVAVIAFLITDSWWWAIGAMLVSGMVANGVASSRTAAR